MRKILSFFVIVTIITLCGCSNQESEYKGQFDYSVLKKSEIDGYLPYTTESIIDMFESSPGFSKRIISLPTSGTLREHYEVYYFLDGEIEDPIASIYVPYEDNRSLVISYNITKNKYFKNKDRIIWCLDQLLGCFECPVDEDIILLIEKYIDTSNSNNAMGDEYEVFIGEKASIILINLDTAIQFDIRSSE